MRKRESAQLNRFRRVADFVEHEAGRVVGARVDRMLERLRSVIAAIEHEAAEHESARRQSLRKTQEERELVATLR